MFKPEPILSVRNLSKTLIRQKVLCNFSMDVFPGEVHALVGQNGSGKSTLIKCLSGYWNPDPGADFVLAGRKLPVPYPANRAHEFGMAFIHQDLGLVPSLTVLENFCLGRGFATGFGGRILWRQEADRVKKLIMSFGHNISPWDMVKQLSSADKTILAIVRALDESANRQYLLVLDESTAALPKDEVKKLFDAIRRVKERKMGIIYVSHRLEEVFQIADRVTVIRDGSKVGTYSIKELNENRLVELIVGRSIGRYYPDMLPSTEAEVLLKVENLYGQNIQDVSFSLNHGEILGVAGLLGSGCSEIGRLLFGAEEPSRGSIWFNGQNAHFKHPIQAMNSGIGLVTEDRHFDGSLPGQTVLENITITDVRRFWKWGRINKRSEHNFVKDLIHIFQIHPPDPDKLFKNLSGGNQQKAILAKWLMLKLKLLICDEPVKGVDIGSKTEIYDLIEKATQEGTAVLLISSEYADLEHMCDRVLVLRNGRIVAELKGDQLTEQRIMELSYLKGQESVNAKNQ